MFVGPGLEPDVAAQLALEAGDDIGGNRFIGMADVRLAVGIADRGGDIERFGHGRGLSFDFGGQAASLGMASEASKAPAISAGRKCGSSTSRKACHSLAPRYEGDTLLARVETPRNQKLPTLTHGAITLRRIRPNQQHRQQSSSHNFNDEGFSDFFESLFEFSNFQYLIRFHQLAYTMLLNYLKQNAKKHKLSGLYH